MKILRCFLLLLPVLSHSQGLKTLTLEQANKLAAANYPLIKQRALIKQTAGLTIENLQKGYLPQVSINGQATYQSEVASIPIKIPNVNIEAPAKDQYRVTTDVSQLIYDGGAIKQQKRLQELNAVVEDQKIDVELQRLRERINELFLGVLLIDGQLKQVNLSDTDINAGIKRVEAQVKYGTALRSNLAVLKAESLKNEQRRIELRSSRNNLLDIMGLFLNQPVSYNAVLIKPDVTLPFYDLSIERSELRLFQLQDSLVNHQKVFISIKNRPKISLFGQGGYGRPGLNMLTSNFGFFAIGGIRFTLPLNNLYTSRNEKELVNISRRNIGIQKENFLLNTNTTLKQELNETKKLEDLVKVDEQIIKLREEVITASDSQLQNGVITASDYIREVNAADVARQNLVLHQLQLLQSRISYLTTLGKTINQAP